MVNVGCAKDLESLMVALSYQMKAKLHNYSTKPCTDFSGKKRKI